MQVGDLVKVNEQCDASALWHKVGIVLSRSTSKYADAKSRTVRAVRVLLDGRERLLDDSALEVINESR